MKSQHVLRALVVVFVSVVLLTGCERETPAPTPPQTRREAVTDVLHGVEIVDHYRWLEDQDSPATRAWIDSQNAYTRSLLADSPRRRAYQDRLTALMAVDRIGRPYERRGRFFVWKKRADDDLWILYYRDGLRGRDNVLVDPHGLSDDHTTSISLEDISEDGRWIAWGIRRGGEDEVEIRIRNVDSGEDLPDRLPRALYNSVDFSPDNTGFYYAARDRDTGTRVRYHRIGQDRSEDTEIFGAGLDPDLWVAAWLSGTGRYLLFYVAHGWASTDLYFKDVSADGPVKTLVEGKQASFEPDFAGDTIVLQTDWQAPAKARNGGDSWCRLTPPVSRWSRCGIRPETEPGCPCSWYTSRGSSATATTRRFCTVTVGSTPASRRSSARCGRCGWKTGGCSRWRTSAAGVSSEKGGTGQACWSTSRTCSTTLSRRPSG
jgi:hypothetical protein